MKPGVFEALHPRIRSGLETLGISEPTPPQEKATKPILAGENVLLVAPTASGKTEAALLPVFDAYMRSKPEKGIGIIYTTSRLGTATPARGRGADRAPSRRRCS